MIHDIQQSQQAYQTLIDDAQSMLNRAFPDPRFPDSSLRPAIAHIVAANRLLLEFEAVVINSVEENLQRCRNGEVDPNDGNNLFGAHIGYVAAVLQHPAITGLISVENEQDGQVSVNTSKMHNNLVQRPAILWKDVLEPLVYETEQAIGRRTHKGAPFFNVGLCYFRAGNLMEAMQYISAAQREDSLSGSDSGLLWGGAIGQQLMRYPHNWLWGTNIAQQYSLVFNTPSQNDDFSRFISLLGFLAQFQRFEAITLVFALQSLTHVREEETDAVRLYSFHALADLLLTLESHLKIRLGRQDTLYSLCSSIVIGTPLQPHWQSIELYWNGQFGSNDWKQTVNQNRFLNDIIRDFQQLHPQSYLAALALYSCARIRNFALHSIDPASVLLSNTASLRQVVAFSLIAFRCSQATHDGSIAGLT